MTLFHAGFDPATTPARVRFSRGGRFDLSGELEALGGRRALVLTTPEQATQGQEVLAALGEAGAGLFSGAVTHTPVSVTETAMAHLSDSGADCLVAIGGG
ncbi:MAG: iron-containing alcohol dehydrogenase, partial [Pararhodobacter sp.]